ncbi:b9 domain-containing protein 2 [Phytophthora cinnamomi]|uniref:b9 domain-containing protein 2 n=1 Tax=Phytophthora cinnamomi TaxID=4785 RepID=UPI00355A624A|nr:b9 domain-containing protein 2 [Phytophthora cinnamomi]
MSGLRAAARCVLGASRRALRPSAAAASLQLTARRAFMSTRAPDALFQTPSFPMPEDASLWLEKYPRADPSHLWKVGSFPLLDAQLEAEQDGALACSEDLWDTPGMLSALQDNLPLRDADGVRDVDALLRQMDGYLADSVVKKRRKKMNKHKHRKRKKALRMRTKKN